MALRQSSRDPGSRAPATGPAPNLHVSSGAWCIRSDHVLRSVRDVIVGDTTDDNGHKVRRFQWDGREHEYDASAPGADGSHLSALHQIQQAMRADEGAGRQAAGTPPTRPGFPALFTQWLISLSDGLNTGTMLALEVRAYSELDRAAVLMTRIAPPAGAASIPPPARMYWHPAREASVTIAQGVSSFINVARTDPTKDFLGACRMAAGRSISS